MSKIEIRKISIVDLNADAIVNAANDGLWAGGGVCGAIFRAAGHDKLQKACNAIGHCDTGSAVITPGFDLKAKYIIHAVGPVWHGGNCGEADQLYSAYQKSLELAVENKCQSIGFPLISAGIFGYPLEKAWQQAIFACRDFLAKNPENNLHIVFAVLDEHIQKEGERILKGAGMKDEQKKQQKEMDELMMDPDFARAFMRANDLANLGVIAPHKAKFYNKYDIEWLDSMIQSGAKLKYVTFWHESEGYENNMFSQWYRNAPIPVNGIEYDTAEQYMMAQKALLFGDLDSYKEIMQQPDPAVCKKLGRGVKNFDQKKWNKAFREILFHGNLSKLQSDIEIVDALLDTENAVLIEASPYDDIYGAGLRKEDLLNSDGSLKVHPKEWHKAGEIKQAENNLGFVLMAVRDVFRLHMGYTWYPGEKLWNIGLAQYEDEE